MYKGSCPVQVVNTSLTVAIICDDHRFLFLILIDSCVSIFAAEKGYIFPPFGNEAHPLGCLCERKNRGQDRSPSQLQEFGWTLRLIYSYGPNQGHFPLQKFLHK